MLLNAASRIATLNINGQDFSDCLLLFEVGDSSLDDSGLVFAEGSVQLKAPRGSNLNLDDRVNLAFKKGNRVYCTANSHRTVLRIREARYNVKEWVQTLTICDLLSYLAKEKNKGDKSGVCVGKPTPVYDIINNLLQSVGAPELLDFIPGKITMPAQGGNPIEVAGKLAFEFGYFLTIADGEQGVRAYKINATRGGVSKDTTQILDYERQPSGEVPASRLVITANMSHQKSRAINHGMAIYSNGRDLRSSTIERFNGNTRTVTTEVQERAKNLMPWYDEKDSGFMLAEKKIETYRYTPRLLYNRPQHEHEDGEEGCPDGTEKILKQKIVEIYKAIGVCLKEWILLHELDENKNITYTNLFGNKATVYIPYHSSMLAYREVTDYSFGFGSAGSISLQPLLPGNSPSTESEEEDETESNLTVRDVSMIKYQPGAVIFAKYFKLTARNNSLGGVQGLTPCETHLQTWRRENGEYVHRESTQASFAIHDSAAADAFWQQIEDSGGLGKKIIATSTVFTGLVTVEDKVTFSSSGQTQPPAPETAPPQTEIKSKQETLKFEVKSKFSEDSDLEPETYTIEYPASTKEEFEAQAEAVGENLMMLAWGRYKSVEITDIVSSYRPLMPLTLAEESGVFNYLVDAYSVALTQTECKCKYDLLWIGGGGATGGTSSIPQVLSGGSIDLTRIILNSPSSSGIPQDTVLYIGGTAVSETVELTASAYVGNQTLQVVATSTALAKNTILTFDQVQVIVAEDVPAGSAAIPILLLSDDLAANAVGSYQQVVGGQPVIVSAYVPPGSLEIPIEEHTATLSPGEPIVYLQPYFNPPFELSVPIAPTLEIGIPASVFDYPLGVVATEEASVTLVFGVSNALETYIVDLTLEIGAPSDELIPASIASPTLLIGVPTDVLPAPFSERYRIRFGFDSPTEFPIRSSVIVDQVRILIVEPFPPDWELSVGDEDNANRFIAPNFIDLSLAPNIIEVNPGHTYAEPTDIKFFLTEGAPASSGFGYIYLREG